MKRIEKIALIDFHERCNKHCEAVNRPKVSFDDFSTALILMGYRVETDPDGTEFVYVPMKEVAA